MWDIPRWYLSACSNSVQYVRLHPILMSILLYHYKELTEYISEVERIEAGVNSKKKEWLTIKKEVEAIVVQKKALLKDSKDVHESDRLFAELDALEWLQRQIAKHVSRISGDLFFVVAVYAARN